MPTPAEGSVQVLTTRALNRALLARQDLLDRGTMPAMAMVEHLVGMQAQNPGDPYVALWSRLVDFDPAELSSAIETRQAVRMALLRMTLHLTTADDAVAIRPVVAGIGSRVFRSTAFAKALVGIETEAVAEAGRAILESEALTTAELGGRLASRWPARDAVALANAVTFHVPLVQVPPRGLWRRSGRTRWRTAEAWLGRQLDGDSTPDGVIRRYLRAFGPASVQDIATWSRLTGVQPIVERLRPELRVFRSEAGKELFDVPDGPLPDPETPAPPRLLPEYDNLVLAHADRRRIIAPEAVGRLTGFVGTILVDGFVAGQWRLDRTKTVASIVLDPFVRLAVIDREALIAEADRLVGFLAPEVSERAVRFGVARAVEA